MQLLRAREAELRQAYEDGHGSCEAKKMVAEGKSLGPVGKLDVVSHFEMLEYLEVPFGFLDRLNMWENVGTGCIKCQAGESASKNM